MRVVQHFSQYCKKLISSAENLLKTHICAMYVETAEQNVISIEPLGVLKALSTDAAGCFGFKMSQRELSYLQIARRHHSQSLTFIED